MEPGHQGFAGKVPVLLKSETRITDHRLNRWPQGADLGIGGLQDGADGGQLILALALARNGLLNAPSWR